MLDRSQSFREETGPAQRLWWFYTDEPAASSVPEESAFFKFLSEPQAPPEAPSAEHWWFLNTGILWERDQMGNINQLPRKITCSVSDRRTPDQPEPGQQWLQIWFFTWGKGAAPDRELLTSRSAGKVSCPASLFPVGSSHSTMVPSQGCSHRLSQRTSQRRWSWTTQQLWTCSILWAPVGLQQVSHRQKIQNRRQKTPQCKEFSISKGQSGCRNKFLLVLSYVSLQEWKKKKI